MQLKTGVKRGVWEEDAKAVTEDEGMNECVASYKDIKLCYESALYKSCILVHYFMPASNKQVFFSGEISKFLSIVCILQLL